MSLTEFRGDALPLGLSGESLESDFGDAVVPDLCEFESFDVIDSRADRATDLILLVSGSRGADVGPMPLVVGVLLVVEVGGDNEGGLRDDSPERLPLVYGSEEEDAADIGERSSGVEESVLDSKFGSSCCF